jgi:uncharacterized cupredoxin-like copper-binding protein
MAHRRDRCGEHEIAAKRGRLPMIRKLAFGVVALVLLLAPSCGGSSSSGGAAGTASSIDPASPITGGTVPVRMADYLYSPDELTVKAGSTVTFVFANEGASEHEAVIGDMDFQDEHEAEMAGGDGMMNPSSDEPEVSAQPGETVELTYTFDSPGTLYIGCHLPHHWDRGMKAKVTVVQ